MLTHRGSARVKAGFYWSLESWSLTVLSGEGGVLPGAETHRYLKVPAALLLLLAPVMGGLYVMFLPFIGFVLVARFMLEKAGVLLARTVVAAREGGVATKKSR
jgi:hypothetical protein